MSERTVLFVDDDEKFLSSIERSFIDESYTVNCVVSGKDALEIMKKQQVHVLVTDMRMPEMNGLELLEIVKKEYPHIVRMFLSGYMPVNSILSAVNDVEAFKILTKPCDFMKTLKPAVLAALEHYDSHRQYVKAYNTIKLG